jgi:Ulp1 family protease
MSKKIRKFKKYKNQESEFSKSRQEEDWNNKNWRKLAESNKYPEKDE